jgi:ABC-type transport system substrate-binding protein
MRTIRLFLYGIPVLLVLLLVASFINASFLSVSKKNEMSIGLIGEPRTLNPIQESDNSSGEASSLIFNGLLKYDQNLDVVGDLATDWKLSQETTFQFATEEESSKAFSFLATPSTEHPISQSLVRGKKLVLTLDQPGLTESEKLLNTLTGAGFHPLPFPPLEKGDKERPFLAEPIIHFTLRQGVRWHDGFPFTSADVLFTYQAIIDERAASPRSSDFELVSSVTTPSPYEVVVRYKKPFSPALLSWMQAMIPAHLLAGIEPAKWADTFNRHPVGTGPFKFDAWKTNEYVRLVRNPDYYLGSPWLDSVVYRVLPDPLTLRLAFETHQVDFWEADPWAVKSFENDPRYELFSSAGDKYYYIGWNLQRPLFQDLRIRQAFAQAVNIQQMTKYILYGRGVQSTGPFTSKMWFFNPKVQPLPYDPVAARALLDAAGWKPGPDGIRIKNGQRLSFTLMTNNGNEIRRDIASLVQDDLKQIGVEVKVEIYEWTVLLSRFVNKGDFDAIALGWGLGISYDHYQIWHSSQTHPEELNFIHYDNPKVDRLLTDIRQDYSRPEILRMAGELQQTIYEDQPYLFLFVPETTSVLWKGSYRLRHPGADGKWIDEPIHMTKAGWGYDMEWFYRPEYPPRAK